MSTPPAPRDSRRARVYAAESQVMRMLDRAAADTDSPAGTVDFFGSSLTLPVERRFGDVASVQRYLDAVLRLPAVRAAWPSAPPVVVRERRGQRAAHYEPGGVIAVPVRTTWALREMVVCHELAHHLATSSHHPATSSDHLARSGLYPSAAGDHLAGSGDHLSTSGDGGAARHGSAFTEAYVTLVGIVLGPEVGLLLRAGLDRMSATDGAAATVGAAT